MKIKMAKSAGFCFGVRRAVDTVYEQIAKKGDSPIYTYGLIIHNMEVVKDLEEKGVKILQNEDDLRILESGTVIIRAHGVARNIHRLMQEKNLKIIDATCPFVHRIHQIVEKESRDGKKIIIIGNLGHPEVEGITGWAEGEVFVVESLEDAADLAGKIKDNACIVSQTTFNYNKFQDMVDIFTEKCYNGTVVNTICNATEERQIETGLIAKEVDAMIVIGDIHSSNTAKLVEISRNECANTYFVQTFKDLPLDLPDTTTLIGITAGASTPNNIIEEVQNYVRINF
ncbi:MAG: 4-hydroxy-3-methylbut-2-enyl diphosphate reductase [Lachnospiraceae bacterium]|nr:4-hydroxy-3-methylbut-2-enyl diphosphate reductase [Lachnospiraceae bacterium]